LAKSLHERYDIFLKLRDGKFYQRRFVFATLCRPPPHQDCGRVETTYNCFARDDKELLPQLLGNQLPGERPRETAEM
jgi:hypothetical protein